MVRRLAFLILTLILSVIGILTGCSQFGLISGSGDIITRDYSFSNFTDIEIGSHFKVEIVPSDTYSLSVTTYENIFNYLNITQSGKTLVISLKPGKIASTSPQAKVTLPVLNSLKISGASEAGARGFQSTDNFSLEVSGASAAEIDLETGNSKINISGASKGTGHLVTLDSDINISGASRLNYTGSANNITLEASGASSAVLPEFTVQNASTNISGASNATLNVSNTLDVVVSGASTLNYSGNATLGKVSVTGASSLNKK